MPRVPPAYTAESNPTQRRTDWRTLSRLELSHEVHPRAVSPFRAGERIAVISRSGDGDRLVHRHMEEPCGPKGTDRDLAATLCPMEISTCWKPRADRAGVSCVRSQARTCTTSDRGHVQRGGVGSCLPNPFSLHGHVEQRLAPDSGAAILHTYSKPQRNDTGQTRHMRCLLLSAQLAAVGSSGGDSFCGTGYRRHDL